MTRLCWKRHGDKASIRMTHLFGYAYYPTLYIIDSAAPLCIPNFAFDAYQIIHYSSAERFHHSLFIRATPSRPYCDFIIHHSLSPLILFFLSNILQSAPCRINLSQASTFERIIRLIAYRSRFTRRVTAKGYKFHFALCDKKLSDKGL